MTDKFVINTLPQLLLISKIPREGKLNVKNGELSIYQGGISNWILRNYFGDGRDATIIYLKDFYLSIKNNVREIIKHNDKEENLSVKKITSENLETVIINLYNSLNGLKNLRSTYRNQLKIISNLELIENHLIISTIKSYINLSNKSKIIFKKIFDDPKINGDMISMDDPVKLMCVKINTC